MRDSDAAFEALFDAVFPRAVGVASRLVGSASAEDIAAEAMIRTYARWHRLEHLPYIEAWVLRTTANLALRAAQKRRPDTLPPLTADQEVDLTQRLVLVEALRKLPRRQREVVTLRYIVDLNERDVAAILHIETGSVKQHGHRGIRRLADILSVDSELLDISDLTGVATRKDSG